MIGRFIDDSISYFDIYEKVALIGVFLVLASIIVLKHWWEFSTSIAVAFFTGIYAFIAFKKMRESNLAEQGIPTVLQEYKYNNDSGYYDFGLKNLGNGPALFLRVCAKIEPDGPTITRSEEERPLHLEEGKFLPLIRGDDFDSPEDRFGFDILDEERRVELYYTFISTSGVEYPRNLTNPREMELSELTEVADNPQTSNLASLRKNCIPEKVEIQEKLNPVE